ncbi:MAG TPA: VOC family protein [Streptosporangiaceae bacterium]|nr:VOC family protein [Streptosporangiaceae bacterium]
MSSAILNITFDCADPRALARFWGHGLGATIVSDRRPEFGWVILADPEGNEFCVEISVGELESAQAATAAT